jgi:hypothetical protein
MISASCAILSMLKVKALEGHEAWNPWSTLVYLEGHGVHGTLSLCFESNL